MHPTCSAKEHNQCSKHSKPSSTPWETTVEECLNKLEADPPTEPEESADKWPEYKQPTGAHDAYHVGDKITYNGKHYTCVLDGCVWPPDTYPQGWQEEA